MAVICIGCTKGSYRQFAATGFRKMSSSSANGNKISPAGNGGKKIEIDVEVFLKDFTKNLENIKSKLDEEAYAELLQLRVQG
uniref:Uncharacterized protein n=1 Tax=Oryza meridionalis TaxID=40149 RepID=A0A0E0E6Z4_9ORYZ